MNSRLKHILLLFCSMNMWIQFLHAQEKTDTGRIASLIRLANQSLENDPAGTKLYAQQATALSRSMHYAKGEGRGLFFLGACEIRNADYKKAADYLTSALKLLLEVKDTVYLIRVYNSFGAIDLSLNREKEVIENDRKALSLARLSHNRRSELFILKNICNFYVEAKDFKTGLYYGNLALQLSRALKSEKDSAYIYDDIGMCYLGLEKYGPAQQYISKALDIQKKLGARRQVVVCLTNLGEILARQEKLDAALGYYQQALQEASAIRDSQFMYMIQLCLGQIYAHQGNYRKAIAYFELCEQYFKSTGDYYQRGLVYTSLAEAYKQLHDYKNALRNKELYAGTKDSILRNSTYVKLARLEKAYDSSQHQARIVMLESAKKLQEERLAHQRQVMLLLIIAALLIISLVVVAFNRMRIKQRIRSEKELSSLERKALQLQMKPHFIFNALGSISGFIAANDTSNALKYLAKFSRLMRYTLESSEMPMVSLEKEIENLENYLKLEQMRFNNKFTYIISCAESVQQDIQIPPMVIQPFLENAILHGITPKDGQGNILISFSREKNKLLCIVEDNGIGRSSRAEETNRTSMGIEITRKRLDILNAGKLNVPSVSLEDLIDSSKNALGTRVTIQFYAS